MSIKKISKLKTPSLNLLLIYSQNYEEKLKAKIKNLWSKILFYTSFSKICTTFVVRLTLHKFKLSKKYSKYTLTKLLIISKPTQYSKTIWCKLFNT